MKRERRACRRLRYYLEGEFGRGARSDGAERAPEVDGGGKRTGSQQHRSLDTHTGSYQNTRTRTHGQTGEQVGAYQRVGGDDSRGERVGR